MLPVNGLHSGDDRGRGGPTRCVRAAGQRRNARCATSLVVSDDSPQDQARAPRAVPAG